MGVPQSTLVNKTNNSSELPGPGPDATPMSSIVDDRTRWRILAVLLVTIFMALVNVSTVNVGLPTIQHGLNASQPDLQWVLSGYALTFGVILVAAGRAGDILGRGGFFMLGVIVFTLASLACGLALTPRALNVARFVQGVGSGLISPQGIGMIQQYFRGAERGRAFGYFGSMVGFSVGVGPVLGGLLIELGGPQFGWRLSFLFNVPLGVIIMVMTWRLFPRPLFNRRAPGAPAQSWQSTLKALDPLGSTLLGLAVFAVLYPFMEYQASPWVWILLPAGLALTLLWVLWERHYLRVGGSPMVDLNIFRTRSFSNGTLIMSLYFLGMTSIWVIIAMYMQEGHGYSALAAGLIGIPAAVLAAYAAHWAGERVDVYGRKVVIGGLLIGMAGIVGSMAVVLLQQTHGISIWWLLLPLTLVGVAQGSVISPNQTLTLDDVPLSYAGSSGAVMQTGQRIGTSVGIALITSALFATLSMTASWPLAVVVAFGVIVVIFALALALAYKDLRDRSIRPLRTRGA